MDEDEKRKAAYEAARARYHTTTELIADAQLRVEPARWDYIASATESETSLKRNRMGIDSLALRPRVMRTVANTDAATGFLGRRQPKSPFRAKKTQWTATVRRAVAMAASPGVSRHLWQLGLFSLLSHDHLF